MQHHRINTLRQYLLLIRLPNVFTAPPNILVGYFATVPLAETNGIHLASLMVSSGLLYIAGIALNDYFDIEVDKRERPGRPLPSGSIPKEHAIEIALVTIVVANIIALSVNPASLAVSLALTATIIAYDYRLKLGHVGIVAMAGTRFLNIILGASTATIAATTGLGIAALAAALMFGYVVAIMMLSRKEVGHERPNVYAAFSIVLGIIVSLAGVGLLLLPQQFQWVFLINLAIFSAVMSVIFRQLATGKWPIVWAVKSMVLSIIILDSIFVAGTAGLLYGLATLLFIVPAGLLAKKLYVT